MPFESESQRRYMWMNHPEIAQRWVDEGSKSKGLPKHKRSNKRKSKRGKRRGRRH